MERMQKRILIAVKTYPTLTLQHQEIVCTAGFLEDGSWIRLYPIRFRHIKTRFKKYQWIDVTVTKHPRDSRPETYMLTGPIRLGAIIRPTNGWRERKRIVLSRGFTDLCTLGDAEMSDISLAIVKPARVVDFFWEATAREWESKQIAFMKQNQLFEERAKPLEKIPFYFRYHFFCPKPNCRGHKLMIEDWETMQLFRKMRDEHGETEGLNKVRQKFFDIICAGNRDTYFFVGTHYRWQTWMILGVFYPPRSAD